jgi:hypothetical protein
MFRKVAVLLLAPALLAGVAIGASRATASDDPNAASFVSKTNAERTSRGLRAYTVAADLVSVAKRHSAEMAAKQSLYHNPNLGTEVSNWQVVGENVGDGGSVDSIHTAFMNSPEHRSNILATDYTEIGIGTVTDAKGVIWVTEVFRLPASSAPAVQPPATSTAARTAPRTVTRPAAPRAAVPTVVKAARRIAPLAPVRPDTATFVTALAPATAYAAPGDPIALALAYGDTLAALNR